MQGFDNENFDKDVEEAKKKIESIEKNWIKLNEKESELLVLETPSGENRYKWKMFENDNCQRVSSHGKTNSINCQSFSTRNSDGGRRFYYCNTCGWYVTWSYCS